MNNLMHCKKLSKWQLLMIFLFGIYAFSCESQTPLEKESEGQSDVLALIVYEGDPAVDGCGWLIQYEQNSYSPINLDSDF